MKSIQTNIWIAQWLQINATGNSVTYNNNTIQKKWKKQAEWKTKCISKSTMSALVVVIVVISENMKMCPIAFCITHIAASYMAFLITEFTLSLHVTHCVQYCHCLCWIMNVLNQNVCRLNKKYNHLCALTDFVDYHYLVDHIIFMI